MTQRPAWVASLPFLVPFGVAFYAFSLAVDGTYEVDALGAAMSVWGVWFLAAVPASVALRLVDRPGLGRQVASGTTLVLSVAAIAFTVHATRNDAPDGTEFSFSYSEAVAATTVDVEDGLEAVVGSGWSVGAAPWERMCVDRFGRDRGAARTSMSWQSDRPMSAQEVGDVARAVEGEGRRILVHDGADWVEFSDRGEIVVEISPGRSDVPGRIGVQLPCLGLEGEGQPVSRTSGGRGR